MSVLRVAAIQLNGSPSARDNLQQLRQLLDEAQGLGATVAVLPENLLCMGERGRDKFSSADPVGQWLWRDRVLALGAERKLGLIAGSLYCHPAGSGDERVLARCWVTQPCGQIVGHYDKRHLFDVQAGPGESYAESRTIAPGENEPVVLECAGAAWGLSICYDLRFAEHYAGLRRRGAQILSVPAAFTRTTGEAHWEVLLRARAIENQCYVVAANQCGTHAGGRETWGHSMIIDPWGRILAAAGDHPAVISAPIDLGELQRLRARFPVHAHRRCAEDQQES